ncbi:MAG: caspase family protein [Nannocystaceae bacterium]
MPAFVRSRALVIGVNDYRHGTPPLRSAVPDARSIAAALADGHGYDVTLLVDAEADRAGLVRAFSERLPAEVGAEDRLLVYFAGHGVAADGEDGPEGFLVPQDARPDRSDTMLSMVWLHDALAALPCRHLLLILDCCFAGSFRWATTRSFAPVEPILYRKRYTRFLADPSWQVLTSASHDQRAADVLVGGAIKNFRDPSSRAGEHSPFAAYLLEGLRGAADQTGPGGERDGVITATELYLYVRDEVETGPGALQTPGLWPLRKHGRGEFIFEVPGETPRLIPDPVLDASTNPWRGLSAYGEEEAALLFGRRRVVEALRERVLAEPQGEPLIAVIGASGTGKSSVVNAGLVPGLRRALAVVGPVRPGAEPLAVLTAALAEIDASDTDARLLVIDQFEELYTLCRDPARREQALALLEARLAAGLQVLITVRADFEPQLRGGPLAPRLSAARFVVPPMSADELREVIEGPAGARVMYFEPPSLIDKLVNEVIATPGGLPLLSFTLSELYRRYLERADRDDRALRSSDYEAMGGVMGALHSRASALVDEASPAERETIQAMILRMVSLGGGQLARRLDRPARARADDDAERERVSAVVDRFVDAPRGSRRRRGRGLPRARPRHARARLEPRAGVDRSRAHGARPLGVAVGARVGARRQALRAALGRRSAARPARRPRPRASPGVSHQPARAGVRAGERGPTEATTRDADRRGRGRDRRALDRRRDRARAGATGHQLGRGGQRPARPR